MKINTDFLEKRYRELKSQNKDEGVFYENMKMRGLKIFINKEPKKVLFNIKIENDNVYIGSE